MARFRIALIVSVILNLFLAGALAGGALWLRGGAPMIRAGSLRIAGDELPSDRRAAFRHALREARVSVRPTILRSRAAKREAARLLRAPTPDPAGILAALAEARTADMTVRAAVEARAVAFAATLPPADRARLADAMQRRAQVASKRQP